MVELTKKQKIEFLKMVSQLASNTAFERKLGLTPTDVASLKREFDIETQDEARRAYKLLEREPDNISEIEISEMKKAREAEQRANDRLRELELERVKKIAEIKPNIDANAIRAEDAERQRNFAAENTPIVNEVPTWKLVLPSRKEEREATIERYRKDIQYQGMQFCINKYGASASQIKDEANNLGLKIRWDTVKR